MTRPSPLTEQEQAELVAYLDGELKEEAAQAVEAKLSLNPAARAEADALRRTWDLLDYLPRTEPSPSFTHRTLERVVPVTASAPALAPRFWQRWRTPLVGVGWAAALLLAGLAGYAGFHSLAPRQPGDQDLVRDLRLIENKRLYDEVEDIDFLKELDQADLFGEDSPGS